VDAALPVPGSLEWLQAWAAGAVIEIVGLIVVLNVAAFLTFAWDKVCAQNHMRRVSEGTLLLLALLGVLLGQLLRSSGYATRRARSPFAACST
jgi:uncharacterized membrane protein YsdA (DUF1294 family)